MMNKWLFGFITFLSIIVLWCFQDSITVNIPWWDDFHGIILPVYDLFTDKSIAEKFHNFISLNNEHRVVNDRVFTLLIYIITGKFELKTLALLGFINLIGIFLVLFKVLTKAKVSYWATLPVVFLLFHAQYYESLQSLMVPFQNFSVILYMALSLYLLIFKRSFVWGFVFAIAAIFSHGNGILVFILGALILLINKNYKHAGIWAILSVLTVFIYFIGYSKPEWANKAVVSPIENPIAAVRYSFEFLGAYALNLVELSTGLSHSNGKQILPQLLGFGTFSLLLFLVLKCFPVNKLNVSLQKLRNNPTNQFFLAFTAFFVATAILMGLTRTGFPVLSRYTINSSLFLIGLWCFYITNYGEKGAIIFSTITFLMVFFTYFNAVAKGNFVKTNTITDGINYQKNGTWANGYSDSSHVSRVNPLLIEPLSAGKYVFPKTALDNFNKWGIESSREVLEYSIIDNYLRISGENTNNADEIFFSLETDQYQFIFPNQILRSNPIDFVSKHKYYSPYYQTFFPISVIPAGIYKIYKIEKTHDSYHKYDLNRKLDTKGMVL